VKDDSAKLKWDLLPWPQLAKVCQLLQDNELEKSDDWKQTENGEQRYLRACARHLLARLGGERIDDKSKIDHLVCTVANALFALWHADNQTTAQQCSKCARQQTVTLKAGARVDF